jgi:hypothetical protein
MTVHTAYLYLNHPTICVIKLCGMIFGMFVLGIQKGFDGVRGPTRAEEHCKSEGYRP